MSHENLLQILLPWLEVIGTTAAVMGGVVALAVWDGRRHHGLVEPEPGPVKRR